MAAPQQDGQPAASPVAGSAEQAGLQPAAPAPPPPSKRQVWAARWAKVKAFVVQHYLPLAFSVAIIFALAYPVPGSYLVHITVLGDVHIIQEVAMGVVFFISGLTLNTNDLKKAKGHVWGVVYGFIAVLFITPCVGFAMREIPLDPQLFAAGLMMYCLVPTTLGVGVALVRACKGNEGVALIMTVGTNMLGVVTMPPMLKFITLGWDLGELNITVDMLDLFAKLSITILAPSVLGKAVRELWPAAQRFAIKWRVELGILNTSCLAFIIWQTLSGARALLFESKATSVVTVIALASGTYLFYLALNYVVVVLLFRMPTPESIAVVITASQKSAPVAITLISYITSDPSAMGVMAIPLITGQLAQIFLGAAMTSPIAARAEAYQICLERQRQDERDEEEASKQLEELSSRAGEEEEGGDKEGAPARPAPSVVVEQGPCAGTALVATQR